MGQPSRTVRILAYRGASEGIAARIHAPLTLRGVRYAPPEMERILEEAAESIERAEALFEQYRVAVAASREAEERAQAILQPLRALLVATHGDQAFAELGAFGMAPPRRRGPKTVAAKEAAIAHAALTREARHTMGIRQRESVTGVVRVPLTGAGASEAAVGVARPHPRE